MRRSIVLAAAIAASTAIFGACEPKANAPETKPNVTSTPASTPATSPSPTSTGSPAGGNTAPKGNTPPEVKRTETKPGDGNVNKDAKPAPTTEKKDK